MKQRYFSVMRNSFINKINFYNEKTTKKITMNHLMDYHKMNEKNQYFLLNEELKTRMAKRIIELQNFPYGLSQTNSFKKVSNWYIQSFKDIDNLKDYDKNQYLNILEKIFIRHSPTILTIANGFLEHKKSLENLFNEKIDLYQYFVENNNINKIHNNLNKFYHNRLSIRLLIDQYIEINKNNNQYGIVSNNNHIEELLYSSFNDACIISSRQYDFSPQIEIKTYGSIIEDFPMINKYMYYSFLELFKNSIMAIINKENYLYLNNHKILVIISYDEDNISIKISDKGIGIKQKDMNDIWNYFYSTAYVKFIDNNYSDDFNLDAPLSGYGYGLPITNLFLNYFDDNISINSIYNVGTDVFIYLKKQS